MIESKTLKAPGHKWGGWITTTKPTHTKEGFETHECSVCHLKETRTIPMLAPESSGKADESKDERSSMPAVSDTESKPDDSRASSKAETSSEPANSETDSKADTSKPESQSDTSIPDDRSKPEDSSKSDSKPDDSIPDDGNDDQPTDGEDETIILGDVNGDGDINVTDIGMVAAHIKGIKALDEKAIKAADVNGDGDVNVTDIAMIAAHIKGIKAIG